MADNNKDSLFVRTTVYLTRELRDEARRTALYTNSNLSHIVRIALREKIDHIRGRSR